MKKVFFLLLLILGIAGAQSWNPQVSGVTTDLMGVCFTDASNGVVCGVNGTILKTADGGANWTPQVSGTAHHLIAVTFTDANTGYIAGAAGTILKTIDGGSTWSALASGTFEDLYGISFANASVGTVVGDHNTILRTDDAGATWTPQSTWNVTPLIGVKMASPTTALAAGYSGTILKTIDGGANWNAQPSGTIADLYTPVCTGIDSWIVTGFNGTILSSTDNGATWAAQTSGTTAQIRNAFFMNANNGFAVGQFGTILKTVDGGQNWTAEASGTTDWLFGITFTDNTHGSAVGFGGLILRYQLPPAPPAPVAAAASTITTSAFDANWNAAAGATGYKLDVATDALYTNFVTGYSDLDVGSVTTYTINTGLSAGTNYWYRVRAYNNSGSSGNSNDISLITLPSAPVNLAASGITRYAFTLGWDAVTGASGYIVDLYYDNTFTTPVAGYQALAAGNVTTFDFTGLVPGYTYYARVRALNASGQGAYSAPLTVHMLHPLADLALTSSVDKANPKNLEVLTYHFTIVNNGPDTAKSVNLAAAIPRGFNFGSAVPVNSFYPAGTDTWIIPKLAPNETAGLTIVDTVDYFNQAYDFRFFYEVNIYAQHDAGFTGVNVGGKTYAGHDISIVGSDFGGQLRTRPTAQDVIIAGNDLNFNSGVVHHGNVVYGVSTNLPVNEVTYPDGALVHGGTVDFFYCGRFLREVSAGLAGYDINGTVVNNSGVLDLNGTDIYLNVFNITGSDFQAAPLINVNVPKGAVAIINVSGTSVQFGGTINANNNPGNFILFNFPQAVSLGITGSSFYGSILAPLATVQATGALFRGQLFVNNLISVSAHQNHSFLGYAPLNRTIPFLPEVVSSFSTDPNHANENNPAVVVINTTTPYGTPGTGQWSVASVLPVNEMVLVMKRFDANTIIAGTNLGRIYRMDNNGVLDTVINSAMTPVAYIHDLAVNDSGHVFAATESGLYRTTDGGHTWINHLPGIEVRSILPGSGNYLYAGTWSFGVYRSSDYGYTWTRKNDNIGSTVITSLMDRNNYNTPYTVFAGTIGAGVSATFTNANTWFNLVFPYEFVTSMAKTSEGIIFVGTLADGVYRSYDNGNTWAKMAGVPDGPIYAIRIDAENNVFVSSWMFGIYGSGDLGDNWSYLGLGGYGISATFPGPDNKLFASAAGKMLVNNSPLTSVKPSVQSGIPEKFGLEQNYPNPFNPATVIKYSLPSAEKVSLKIFNTLGKEVAVIINNEAVSAGYHQVTFNASQLPSGVYFYRLQAGKYIIAKKMLLLK